METLDPKTLIGKTIKSVDSSSVNVWALQFTDGTSLDLEAEDAVYTPNGNIPGIFLTPHKEYEKR